jgi:molybdopterin-guanine dinucleotide biosynthesis protein A
MIDSVASLRPQLTAAILAGGRGERLGGADKGLVCLGGRPLAHWVLDAVRPQAGGILIVANRNPAEYAALGVPVVSDPWPDFRGPLAGMFAALRESATRWVLTVPCDAARLPDALGLRLFTALDAADAPAAYATADGDDHYLCCLLRRELEAPLLRALDAGESAPRRWLADIGAVSVDFSDVQPTPVWSLNTAAELAAAEAFLLSGAGHG